MAKGKGGGTVGTVEALVTPVLEQLGMRLWDVRFEKEGPDWFLRIYIDRDEPLDLNACEEATRAINPVIDAADPIDQSYFMEVGSPGLGRKLTRDAHFEAMRGRRVAAHLIRATAAGEKDVAGILQGKDGARVTLLLDDGSRRLSRKRSELLQIVRR
ncbi:MAG: ribosome maturation factor RimP [Ruthenibacterium lactatiformans]